MILKAQDKDYNCGVYAVQFFLSLYGIHTDITLLERILEVDEDAGTNHKNIRRVILAHGLEYTEHYDSQSGFIDGVLPAIVNMQSDGDGHYVVFLGTITNNRPGERTYFYYDPGDGEIKTISEVELNKVWYSERYGVRWFCSALLNNDHD